jgi:uncharacterized protein YpmB
MIRHLSVLLALCVGLACASSFVGCKKDKAASDEDDANEKQVDVSKIPPAAMDSIKKEIGDAKIKRVLMGQKRGKAYYEAKYNDPTGKRMMVQVAEDGKVYKKVEDDDPEPK